jgi:hypothetical protein
MFQLMAGNADDLLFSSSSSTPFSSIILIQTKQEKNRKRTEKLIAESQERSYWLVYRPPPGAPNRLEIPPYVQLRQPDRITYEKCAAEVYNA